MARRRKSGPAMPALPWRRRLLRLVRLALLNRFTLMVALPGLGLLIIWMRFVEANRLTVRLEEVPVSSLECARPSRRVRVLHLSDLHLTSEQSLLRLQDAIEKGLRQRPDLAVITGDTCLPQDERLVAVAETYFAYLRSVVPTFACLGNHDVAVDDIRNPPGRFAKTRPSERLLAVYGASGVRLLRNESSELIVNGVPVTVAGLEDLWTGHPRPEGCLRARGESGVRRLTLLLSHNPDSLEQCGLQAFGWDVMFSGHTHGGQFRFPLTRWCPFAPVENGAHAAKGLYDVGRGQWLSVTSGVGNYLEMRLNCLPEATVVDIVP